MSTSKYRNIRRNGFDSRKEERRYNELLLLEESGNISDLKRQVPFELIPKQRRKNGKAVRECIYKADFTYYENGEFVVEDVKPKKKDGSFYTTPEFKIKEKLMLQKGYEIRLV